MKGRIQRESILSVLGFSVVTGVFLFGFYLPGHKASALIKQEIASTEQSIRDVPKRVAELEILHQDISMREEYLDGLQSAVPVDPDVYALLDQVADLARNSSLLIAKLQPMPAEVHESYQSLPFQLSFSGPFRGAVAFLKGIESGQRFFSVQKFTLSRENERNGANVQGEVQFSIYVNNSEKTGSPGNDGRATQKTADTGGG